LPPTVRVRCGADGREPTARREVPPAEDRSGPTRRGGGRIGTANAPPAAEVGSTTSRRTTCSTRCSSPPRLSSSSRASPSCGSVTGCRGANESQVRDRNRPLGLLFRVPGRRAVPARALSSGSVTANGRLQIGLYALAIFALTKPLGLCRGRPAALPRVLGPVQRLLYRLSGVDPKREQGWRQYTTAMLLFSIVTMATTDGITYCP